MAVRGPDTLKTVEKSFKKPVSTNVVLGDPGILLHYLGMDSGSCRQLEGSSCEHKYCLVTHGADGDKFFIHASKEHNLHHFSPYTTWGKMTKNLESCEFVLCRSLHCIIMSNAMDIPNVFFQFKNNTSKEPILKYIDYYKSVGLSADTMPYYEDVEQAKAYLNGNQYRPVKSSHESMQALVDAFPYFLFHRKEVRTSPLR